MIDEKKLKELQHDLEHYQFPLGQFLAAELYDTIEMLWPVVRAAQKLAIIGDCKVIGWNKLNKALHALREREGLG